MTLRRTLELAFVAAAVGLGFAVAAANSAADYKVIVHPDNPVTELDRQFLRDAYLRKASGWRNGQTIRPIDLTTAFAVRGRFSQEVLRKTPAQLKSYWNQQIFSGKGVPPPETDSTAAVVSYVVANPGAVGYLPIEASSGGAKVVEVK